MTLRFANFLSPVLQRTYEHIASYIGERKGSPTLLTTGQSVEEFAAGTGRRWLSLWPPLCPSDKPTCLSCGVAGSACATGEALSEKAHLLL
jgi:hypothetical protein